MRRINYGMGAWCALGLLVLLGAATPAADPPATGCRLPNTSWQSGEQLVYKLYYNWNFVWLSAGEVVFDVRDRGAYYHLTANGRTYPSYNWFFRVRDRYESYLDKRTLQPLVSIREVHEGGYQRYDSLAFDAAGGTVYSERGKTADGIYERETYAIESCMHDVLSVLYHARNVDFGGMREGDQVPVNVFMDKKTYPLKVHYLGQEEAKKIKGLGRFDTQLFSPEVVAGDVFNADTEMKVWVSDDANRLPLLIESPVSVGSVKAVLKSYRNLRHPLRAAVE